MRGPFKAAFIFAALFCFCNAHGRDLQQVALPSAFPGADSGDVPPADASPSPAAAAAASSPSPSSPSTSPSSSPATSPATSPTASKAPTPAPAAGAPATGPAPATAPGPAPVAGAPGPAKSVAPAPGPASATAGAGAPAAAAIATGKGDLAPSTAPGNGTATTATSVNGTVNIIYMQQAGNVQMLPTAGNPLAGTLFMNNALDTTLYDQDYPVRKLGKTSTNNFLNAAGGNVSQWFAPAPQGLLIGFNTTYNVYALVTVSQPVYNFTTNTVTFGYLLGNPNTAIANSATNGFAINYYLTANDSGVLPVTGIEKQTPLFTPTLFYTIPCTVADGPVPPGSCTLSRTGVCTDVQRGQWKNATFCA